jgi:hypothetical protein
VIPPQADAEFVCAMEDVLEVYHRAFDPDRPVVCVDESSKQLVSVTGAISLAGIHLGRIKMPTTQAYGGRRWGKSFPRRRYGVAEWGPKCLPLEVINK